MGCIVKTLCWMAGGAFVGQLLFLEIGDRY